VTTLLAQAKIDGPEIAWAGISPLIALIGGSVLVLLLGLFRARPVREHLVPLASLATIATALGLTIWQWGERQDLIEGAMRLDDLTLSLTALFCVAGITTVLISWRHLAPRESSHGEFHALLLASLAGMVVLVGANDLVALFIGLELLSIPLYVLCATEMRREGSLESGLKYLIIGSVGSATLLFGSAYIYGAAGSTGFAQIAAAIAEEGVNDSALLLVGIGLVVIGLAFKASVAPFHQWTPDVYEGAPTPVTALMAVATKAAAIGITLRLFDVALISVSDVWQPMLAALAALTIVVGNVGALGQRSLKRMLAYSGVAQAGYLLAGVVVATQAGVEAAVFYLAAYTVMNLAAFAVIVARQAERPDGDDLSAYRGLGTERPLLAWPLTLAMLGLAGFPLTAGFIGKFALIEASVEGDYTWLGVMIVIGSMISLGYYLKVVAVMWGSVTPEPGEAKPAGIAPGPPVMAGGSPEADTARAPWEVLLVALVFGLLTLAIGVYPQPLFELAQDAASSFPDLF
jgi:NADH-quinone oxidoreductase subunit N